MIEKKQAAYTWLYGPVPSRRLGRSLGIDVTPFKTCSIDCLFCQCGCTTTLTTERAEFVPLAAICAELDRWLEEDGSADCITFAGSGEPTLYSRLGELIEFIKTRTGIPVIVLSNGTLLHRADVRAELLAANQVKVSLSAWDEASFRTINRPAPGLSFEQMLAGEQLFRTEFSGELWLEVFLMDGINADPEQVKKLAAAATTIRPDKIHLNTAVRPPADPAVRPVSKETLEVLCGLFTPHAEIIASFSAKPDSTAVLSTEKLLDVIRRHPATADQLAQTFGVQPAVILPLLAAAGLLLEARDGEIYYKCR